jgi:hypothetical protein
MFKLCPFFSLPLYLVATGLRTIQFLFLMPSLAYRPDIAFRPTYRSSLRSRRIDAYGQCNEVCLSSGTDTHRWNSRLQKKGFF